MLLLLITLACVSGLIGFGAGCLWHAALTERRKRESEQRKD